MPRYVVRLQVRRRVRRGREYTHFFVTVPKEIAELLGLRKGQRMEVRSTPQGILFTPLSESGRPRRGALPV